MSDHFLRYEAFLSSYECWKLLEDSLPRLGSDFRTTVAKQRSGYRWKMDTPETLSIRQYASRLTAMPLENVEPVEVVRYQPGASYPVHGDLPWRSHTVLIYLNENYEGGRTFFPRVGRDGYRVEPKTGHAFSWENSRAPNKPIEEMDHCVEELISGEKWVAVCWVQWSKVDPELRSGVRPGLSRAG